MNITYSCRNLLFLAFLLVGANASGAEAPKDSGKAAAKCTANAGVALDKQPDGTWKTLKVGDTVPSGTIFVGMPLVDFVSVSGTVQGRLLADIGNRGPFPVLEAGVIFHDAAGVDLDLTFDRGLLVLENLKKEGQVKVRLRVRDETWVLHLQTPGTKVGLEIFDRHAPPLPRVIDATTDNPTTDLLMLVITGQAFLDTGKEGMGMRAPPGLARLHWNSVSRKHTFQQLDKLPETLMKLVEDQEGKTFKAICAGTAKLTMANLGTGLDDLIKSTNPEERQVGVTLAGAMDDLPRLFGVLMTSPYAAARDHAIIVLRSWLGREPGQIQKLQDALMATKKVTPVQARNLLQLFIGFDDEERQNPDTYAVLLTYLAHQNQAVRALAYWHLVRLAPAGKGIAFDAAAPEEQRRQAVERWHALIPEGQLPPRPKAQSGVSTP